MPSYLIDEVFRCRSDAQTGGCVRRKFGHPGIHYQGHHQPSSLGCRLDLMKLEQAVHLENGFLLAFVVPGVKLHRTALFCDERTVHGGMRDLRSHLAWRQLDVLAYHYDHFIVESCHLDSMYDLP